MQVLIKHSDFYAEEEKKYQRIVAIIDFVNSMREGLYTDEELDQLIPEAEKVYFVDYYDSQIKNGGFSQYLFNTCNLNDIDVQNSIVKQGLEQIKAHEHLELFNQFCAFIATLDESAMEQFYEDKMKLGTGSEEIMEQLHKFDESFYNLCQNGSDLEELEFDFIPTIQNIRIVADDEYEAELNKLLALVPNYEQRKIEADKEYLENMPRYAKVIDLVCEKCDLELVEITAIDYGDDEEEIEKNLSENKVLYHFITNKGYSYIVDSGTECSLIDPETDETIYTMRLEAEDI